MQFQCDKPILCLGDVNPDIILPYGETVKMMRAVSEGKPRPEGSDALRSAISSGGSIGNTASGLGRLGANVMFAGMAGNDYFGKFVKEDLDKDGVDTRYLILDSDISTVMLLAVIGEDKDRILFTFPPTQPSHLQLKTGDLPDSLMDEIGWLHSTGFMMREEPAASAIVDAYERARSAGKIVSLDLNLRIETNPMTDKFKEDVWRCAEASNILFGSGVEEFMPFTGKSTPEEAALSLVREDRIVVSRAGGKGVHVYAKDYHYFSNTFDVEVVDTVGAGDGFNAGFISAASRGLPLEQCVTWGNAVACYNIGRVGGRCVPAREVMEEFIKNTPLIGD